MVAGTFHLYLRSRQCDGERLLRRLALLEQVHALVGRNARALCELLPQSRSGGVLAPIDDFFGRTEASLVAEFVAALHAVFASVATLDTSMREIAATGPRAESSTAAYEERHARVFGASPKLRFAAQLGALVLRTGYVPWSVASLERHISSLTLDRDQLRLLHVWHGPARAYIRGQGPDVDPQDLVKTYASAWSELYEWFVRRTRASHRIELEERASLRDQLAWALAADHGEET